MDVFTPVIQAFRFHDDDAGEAASTPLGAEGANVTLDVSAGNVAFQLRYRIQATTAVAGATTDDYTLQRSHNSGAYASVNGSTVVGAAAAGLTNNGATTNRATNGITDGTGSFVAGEQSTDGTIDDWQLTASNFSEIVFGGTAIAADVNNGDTIDFRVSLNGGTPGMTNSVTPRITIQKAVSGSGALSSGAAAVDGGGNSNSTGTGALAAQAATIGGDGVAGWVGTGALAAQAASVTGEGTTSSTGTGALASQAATVEGEGASSSTGTGALAAPAASVDGNGTSSSTGTGALSAQAAAAEGAGAVTDGEITGAGALAAPAGAIAGSGVSRSTGTGALAAQAAAADGGGVSSSSGSGALSAPAASGTGAGVSRSTGTAALEAAAATVAGAGSSRSLGSGILEAGNAIIVGIGQSVVDLVPRDTFTPAATRAAHPTRQANAEPAGNVGHPASSAAYSVPARGSFKAS